MHADTHAKHRLGDTVWSLASSYAARMNASGFATSLRTRRMPRQRYVGFLSMMYPSVVGFNRALIKSISKVDHVRQSGFVKALAEQLKEEQDHNQMWRRKLEVYGIDHEALYRTLEGYLERFTPAQMDRMTRCVLDALGKDLENTSPGCFPDPAFPEPVLALYHHLWMTASREDVHYWEHFASQGAIEAIIFDVVSTSVWPGVVGNPELDGGSATIQWWKEHARQGSSESGVPTDEEKHLQLSQLALNRTDLPPDLSARVTSRAEDTMRLFAATLLCMDHDAAQFRVERFRKG